MWVKMVTFTVYVYFCLYQSFSFSCISVTIGIPLCLRTFKNTQLKLGNSYLVLLTEAKYYVLCLSSGSNLFSISITHILSKQQTA